jgi:formimidoylglutamase
MSLTQDSPPFLVAAAPLAPAVRDAFDRPVTDLIHLPSHAAVADALLSLVAVPFDTTTMGRRGSKHGPAAMRQALTGLLSYHGGFDVDLGDSGGLVDYGDVDVVDTDVAETWSRISAVTRMLASKPRPLAVLGGDHGLTFPALRGVTEERTGTMALVSLDAHFDVRPEHRGQPASGVPFRYALERLDGRVVAEASSQIGAAGWENSGAAAGYLRERGVRAISAREVHRRGVEVIATEVLERAAGAEALWLTLDIDAVDAAFAPGTNAPTVGGLTSHQFLEFAWLLGRGARLAGFDIVEVSPPLDVAGITSLLGAQVLLTVLAARHASRPRPSGTHDDEHP